VHHVGILYDQFMMHGRRNIKLYFIVCDWRLTVPVSNSYLQTLDSDSGLPEFEVVSLSGWFMTFIKFVVS